MLARLRFTPTPAPVSEAAELERELRDVLTRLIRQRGFTAAHRLTHDTLGAAGRALYPNKVTEGWIL
jgi:hypothetical protein